MKPIEHKLVSGGEQYLPFARGRVKAMRATGMSHASQQFVIDGFTVAVRIEPGHDHIRISGGSGLLWVLITAERHGDTVALGSGTDVYTDTSDVFTASKSGERESLLLKLQMFSTDGAKVYDKGSGSASFASTGEHVTQDGMSFWAASAQTINSDGYLNTVSHFMPFGGEAVLVKTNHPPTWFGTPNRYGSFTGTMTFEIPDALDNIGKHTVSTQTLKSTIKFKSDTWTHNMDATHDLLASGGYVLSSVRSFVGEYIDSPPIYVAKGGLRYLTRAPIPAPGSTMGNWPNYYADWSTWSLSFQPGEEPTRLKNTPRGLWVGAINGLNEAQPESWAYGLEGSGGSGLTTRASPPFSLSEVGWHKQGWNFIHRYRYVYDRLNTPASERQLLSYKTSIVLSSSADEIVFIRWKNTFGSMADLELCAQRSGVVVPLKTMSLLKAPGVGTSPLIKRLLEKSYVAHDYANNRVNPADPASYPARAVFDYYNNAMCCTPFHAVANTEDEDPANQYELRIQVIPDQQAANDKNVFWNKG